MAIGRLPVVSLSLALLVLPASAAEGPASTASAAAQPAEAPPAAGQPPDNAPQPAPAVASSGEAGLVQELTARLAVGGTGLTAADREDRAALAAFYAARQHEPAWVGTAGLTPAAEALAGEIRRADDWGLEASAFRLPATPAPGAAFSRGERADAEMALSFAILKYARHARGSRADPATLSKHLDRRLPLLDPARVIAAAAKAESPDAYLRSLHPQHPEFEALRQKYLALKGGHKVALAQPGPAGDDKRAGKGKAAGAPEPASARKLLVNMEQWRWMPESLGDFYVWVNVPEFTLRVVKQGQVIHTERVIVGKVETPTPVFSQEMEQVIFHPFWGVPESIKRYDILPSLARGSSRVLSRYNLRLQKGGRDIDPEAVDWATADIRHFHVYQPPGDGNVLGVVKFRFPNKHDVYMHDTPTKNLFNATVRTFSHGCMRVRDPQRLAELLLAEDQGWPAARVAAAMAPGGPQNNQISLGRKFPVHVTYFTAMAADDGKLKLAADIYEHESKIALGIEGKAHLIPRWKEDRAPSRAEPVGRLEETSNDTSGKKDWGRRALNNFGSY